MIEGSIDNPLELLICALFVLAMLMTLFKIANWLENRPVKEKKPKKSKAKPAETIKEPVKETKEEKKDIVISRDEIVKEVKEQVYKEIAVEGKSVKSSDCPNYLYDRFVESPSIDDNLGVKKPFQGYLSDEEANAIRNRNIQIKVNDVEDLSILDGRKNELYKKIEQMASENIETKEQMLLEFEKLPKSMKLLLIENIMQKM